MMRIKSKGKYFHVFLFCFITLLVSVKWVPHVVAYQEYADTGSGGCDDCHGDFRSNPYTSLVDGQSWGDDLHDVHRNTILPGDCNACHTSGGRSPVIIDSCDGGIGLAAISCMGCHGRDEDMGNDGLSAGRGAGLRQHHNNNGVGVCLGCHSDSNPAAYTPVGEDTAPSYYFTPDANHAGKPTDPCSPAGEEDYKGTAIGLDNDGDDAYDGADTDCSCGNGVVDPGEDCDGTACCEADCSFSAAGTACPDGLFCNGDETCDGAGTCDPGTAVDCDDGVACTDDSCNEGTDSCDNVANDANCDDGLFCNGSETCDAVANCQAGTPVDCDDGVACTDDSCNEATDSCDNVDNCPPGETCNPGTGLCEAGGFCGDGNVDPGEDCDGGQCCEADCSFSAAGSACPDGLFCNGDETCDGAGTCDPGTPVDCDDGVACTDDSCNEGTDSCDNVDNCPPGETCNLGTGLCEAGSCGDGNVDPGEDCDSTECCEADCTFTLPGTPCTDDGQFCNGEERCDGAGNCASTGDPCPPGTVPPNREGAHTPHNALDNVTGDCDTCHNGAGSGTSSHFNGTNDIAFSGTTYSANSILPGQPTHDSGTHTCSGVSCHGATQTPDWFNGVINVNTDCEECHELGPAEGTPEFNSYYSGEHDEHVGFIFCTICHDTSKLPTNHFTTLNTSDMEGPASATIRDGLNYDTSVSPATCSPGPACHFDDDPIGSNPREW